MKRNCKYINPFAKDEFNTRQKSIVKKMPYNSFWKIVVPNL